MSMLPNSTKSSGSDGTIQVPVRTVPIHGQGMFLRPAPSVHEADVQGDAGTVRTASVRATLPRLHVVEPFPASSSSTSGGGREELPQQNGHRIHSIVVVHLSEASDHVFRSAELRSGRRPLGALHRGHCHVLSRLAIPRDRLRKRVYRSVLSGAANRTRSPQGRSYTSEAVLLRVSAAAAVPRLLVGGTFPVARSAAGLRYRGSRSNSIRRGRGRDKRATRSVQVDHVAVVGTSVRCRRGYRPETGVDRIVYVR